MYRCIIVDDQPHAIDGLKGYIDSFPGLKLIGSYTDPLEALMAIQKMEHVDLIFLDIEMPKINGLELSREIRSKTDKLIFTTGHTKYGYEAFKVHADDYLLKPYTLGEFAISMTKLFAEKHATDHEFFFVKNKDDNHKMVNIKYTDVIAVESKLNYVMIYTTTKNVLAYMSLNEIAKLFKDLPQFVQFQRSYIISKRHIDYFDGNSIKMNNGLKLTVGEYYRKSFAEFVTKYSLNGRPKPGMHYSKT